MHARTASIRRGGLTVPDASITREPQRSGAQKQAWWLPGILGASSVAAGIVVLLKPANSLATVAVVCGVLVLVDGVLELLASLEDRVESRAMQALLGIVGIVVGVLLIRHPIEGVTAVALIVGTWLVAVGAVRLAWTVSYERRAWSAVLSLAQIAGGIVIVSIPSIGLTTFALLAGLVFLFNGLVLIALAWVERPVAVGSEVPPRGAGASA
jgi:uncharacterized membrane protein HdeD (DUF308 family)